MDIQNLFEQSHNGRILWEIALHRIWIVSRLKKPPEFVRAFDRLNLCIERMSDPFWSVKKALQIGRGRNHETTKLVRFVSMINKIIEGKYDKNEVNIVTASR